VRIVQGTGALNGWLLGVVIGPGTLFVIVTARAVDLMTCSMPALGAPPGRRTQKRRSAKPLPGRTYVER
jgi:hypothetical protein